MWKDLFFKRTYKKQTTNKYIAPEKIVYITDTALNKIKALVKHCDVEIAWHGTVKHTDDKLIITNILVPPQIVTGVTTTSDDVEYNNWLNTLPDKEFNSLRFHGHSHVNMGVSPSSIDINYRTNLIKNMPNSTYIFMIINKKGDFSLEIREKEHIYNNVKLKTINNYTSWALKEIKTKTKKKEYDFTPTYDFSKEWDDLFEQYRLANYLDNSKGGQTFES